MAYNRTRYTRGVVATLAAVNTLSSPQLGETCFCSENGRVMTYDGELWMCDDFIKATNVSGATVAIGDTLTWQTTAGTSTQVTISTDSFRYAGIVVYAAANNAPVALAYKGIYKVNIVGVLPSPYNRLGYQVRISASTSGKSVLTTLTSGTWFGWNVEIVPGGGLTKCLLRGKPEYI